MLVAGHPGRDIRVTEEAEACFLVLWLCKRWLRKRMLAPFGLAFIPFAFSEDLDISMAHLFSLVEYDIRALFGSMADDRCPGPFRDIRELKILIVDFQDCR